MNIVVQADIVDWDEMSIVIGCLSSKDLYLYFKLNSEWITINRLLHEAAVDCWEELSQFTDLADWFQDAALAVRFNSLGVALDSPSQP